MRDRQAMGIVDRGSLGFYGREQELTLLREAYLAAAGGSPHYVVLLGDPGMGKTRLAQEFHNLLSREIDRPGNEGYWPDTLGSEGDNLLVSPSLAACNIAKEPPYLWWGLRVPTQGYGGALGTNVLAQAEAELLPHVVPLLRRQSRTNRLRDSGKVLGDLSVDLAISAFESVAMLGVVKSLGKAAIELGAIIDRSGESAAGQSLEEMARASREQASQIRLDALRAAVRARPEGVPLVLLIDDAQFAVGDPGLLHFVGQLVGLAEQESWPLLLVVTHWVKEWHEHPARGATLSLAGLFGERAAALAERFQLCTLGPIEHLDRALEEALPGLGNEAAATLLARAGGNPRHLDEIIRVAIRSPAYFEGRDFRGDLKAEGLAALMDQTFSIEAAIDLRLASLPLETQEALVLGSLQGTDFMKNILARMGQELALGQRLEALPTAETPHAFVRGADRMIVSFVQGTFREVARRNLPRLFDEEQAKAALETAVRQALPKALTDPSMPVDEAAFVRSLAYELLDGAVVDADRRLAGEALAGEIRARANALDGWGIAQAGLLLVQTVRELSPPFSDAMAFFEAVPQLVAAGEYEAAREGIAHFLAIEPRNYAHLGALEAAFVRASMRLQLCDLLARKNAPFPQIGDLLNQTLNELETVSTQTSLEEARRLFNLADTYSIWAGLLSRGDIALRLEHYGRAIALYERGKALAGGEWTASDSDHLANFHHNRAVARQALYPPARSEVIADLRRAQQLRGEAKIISGGEASRAQLIWHAQTHRVVAELLEEEGRFDEALAELADMLALLAILDPDVSSSAGAQGGLLEDEDRHVSGLRNRARLLMRLGRLEEARDDLARARQRLEKRSLTAQGNVKADAVRKLAEVWQETARLLTQSGQTAEAMAALERARQKIGPLAGPTLPELDDIWMRLDLASSFADAGAHEAALEQLDPLVSLLQPQASTEPWLRALASAQGRRSRSALAMAQPARALSAAEQAFSALERAGILQAELGKSDAEWLAALHHTAARSASRLEKLQEALMHREHVVALRQGLLGAFPDANPSDEPLQMQIALTNAKADRAATRRQVGLVREALEDYSDAAAFWASLVERKPRTTWSSDWRRNELRLLDDYARAMRSSGAAAGALEISRTQLVLAEELVAAVPAKLDLETGHLHADGWHSLAWSLEVVGQFTQAREAYRQAVAHREQLCMTSGTAWTGSHQLALLYSVSGLSDLTRRFGTSAQAIEAGQRHLEIWEAFFTQLEGEKPLSGHFQQRVDACLQHAEYLAQNSLAPDSIAAAIETCDSLLTEMNGLYAAKWSDETRQQLALLEIRLATLKAGIGSRERARTGLDRAIGMFRDHAGSTPLGRFAIGTMQMQRAELTPRGVARERDYLDALALLSPLLDEPEAWSQKQLKSIVSSCLAVHSRLATDAVLRLRVLKAIHHAKASQRLARRFIDILKSP